MVYPTGGRFAFQPERANHRLPSLMSLSFDLASLHRAFRGGRASPISVAEEVLLRIAFSGGRRLWISRVPNDALLANAKALEASGPGGLVPSKKPGDVADLSLGETAWARGMHRCIEA
jgi:hypothetical protein